MEDEYSHDKNPRLLDNGKVDKVLMKKELKKKVPESEYHERIDIKKKDCSRNKLYYSMLTRIKHCWGFTYVELVL